MAEIVDLRTQRAGAPTGADAPVVQFIAQVDAAAWQESASVVQAAAEVDRAQAVLDFVVSSGLADALCRALCAKV